MDSNYKQEPKKPELTLEEIAGAKDVIRTAITKSQQCFFLEINKENNDRFSFEAVSSATREMINNKEIRLKEDSYEHDWEYLFV